jgi:hypothetical protein
VRFPQRPRSRRINPDDRIENGLVGGVVSCFQSKLPRLSHLYSLSDFGRTSHPKIWIREAPADVINLFHCQATAFNLLNRVVHSILSGHSRIALAITEPDAGSDVQGLQTEAQVSESGTHFIINGQKKVSMIIGANLIVS